MGINTFFFFLHEGGLDAGFGIKLSRFISRFHLFSWMLCRDFESFNISSGYKSSLINCSFEISSSIAKWVYCIYFFEGEHVSALLLIYANVNSFDSPYFSLFPMTSFVSLAQIGKLSSFHFVSISNKFEFLFC